jgi:hypothetical protein
VAPDIERRRFAREPDSVIESSAGRHERRRRQDPFAVRRQDPGIYVAREAEIIGIDDQLLQRSTPVRTGPV